MKDYSTLPNTTGSFPNVEAQNASGPGETDGTPYVKQVIDDLWGARQALLKQAEIIPSGVQESADVSQALEALKFIIGAHRARAANWTELPFTTSTDAFRDVAFSKTISSIIKRRWVAVGTKGASTGIWSSRGGLSEWTARTNPAGGSGLEAVIWDPINNLFIVVGIADVTDADILTSPDGKTWTERSNPKTFDLNDLASDGTGIIVAVGDPDGTDAYIVTSPDGSTWTERSNPKNIKLNAITYSPDLDLFCAVGEPDGSDAYIVTSQDGITWTERSNPQNFGLYDIAWGNGKFVAVGEGLVAGYPYIVESDDGITWNQITSLTEIGNNDVRAITFSDDIKLFVALTGIINEDDSPPIVAYSEDGVNWSVYYLPVEGFTPFGIGSGEGGITIVGGSGKIINSARW